MLENFIRQQISKRRYTKMTERVKQPNTKPRQFEIIVNFMKDHPDLAKGQVKGLAAKQKSNNLWKRMEIELNSCGPPSHNFEGWKKIWADYKSKIKTKLRRNKESMSGTGGGPSRFCTLTAMEEEVVALLSIDKSVNGVPHTVRFGASAITNANRERNIDVAIYGINNHQTQTSPSNITTSSNNTQHTAISPSVSNRNTQHTAISPPITNHTTQHTAITPLITNHTTQHTTISPPSRFHPVPTGKENLLKFQVENQCKYHENSIKKLEEISNRLSSYFKKNIEMEEANFNLKGRSLNSKKKIEKKKLILKELKLKRRCRY